MDQRERPGHPVSATSGVSHPAAGGTTIDAATMAKRKSLRRQTFILSLSAMVFTVVSWIIALSWFLLPDQNYIWLRNGIGGVIETFGLGLILAACRGFGRTAYSLLIFGAIITFAFAIWLFVGTIILATSSVAGVGAIIACLVFGFLGSIVGVVAAIIASLYAKSLLPVERYREPAYLSHYHTASRHNTQYPQYPAAGDQRNHM
eukprot:TRINITY_DN1040_c0_g1_i1.p1 TRINITY_DN1040_c0_g1~~TRINITY_DN1040_c0_g1_i1.p1  ORF type:complete len:204 (-),score=31.98 TRINITY_DN1040_c0_g1_i1:570-1181(-)